MRKFFLLKILFRLFSGFLGRRHGGFSGSRFPGQTPPFGRGIGNAGRRGLGCFSYILIAIIIIVLAFALLSRSW
jgi:hypothetical protein